MTNTNYTTQQYNDALATVWAQIFEPAFQRVIQAVRPSKAIEAPATKAKPDRVSFGVITDDAGIDYLRDTKHAAGFCYTDRTVLHGQGDSHSFSREQARTWSRKLRAMGHTAKVVRLVDGMVA